MKRIKTPKIYALRLFIDGRRIFSHELTKTQANRFRKAARHLTAYLETSYSLSPQNKKGD